MRTLLHLILVLTAALTLVGCDAPGGSAVKETDEPVDRDRGRQLFQQTCRACHALVDAKAAGVFGPDLDLLQPDAERVREQISSGGGGMPPDLLDGEDADTVARYVEEVAGAKPEVEGDGGTRGNATPTGDDG